MSHRENLCQRREKGWSNHSLSCPLPWGPRVHKSSAGIAVHGPDMIGQASGHGWGHRLPLLGRSVVAFGRHRVRQALAQTAVWHHEMVVRKGESKLIFQVVLVFREGIDLPSHPSGVLAYCQVVALHAIRIDGVADRRRPQGRLNLLSGPVDDARGDVDHPPMRALFDDHRVAQVGWRVAAGVGGTPTGPFPWGGGGYTLNPPQNVGQEGAGGAGGE